MSLTHINCLEQCLTHKKCSLNVCSRYFYYYYCSLLLVMSLQNFFPQQIQWNISTLKAITRWLMESDPLVEYIWKIGSQVQWVSLLQDFPAHLVCQCNPVALNHQQYSDLVYSMHMCTTNTFTGQVKLKSLKMLCQYRLYFFLKACDEIPLASRFVLSAFGPMDGIKQPTFPIKSLPLFPLPRRPKGRHDYHAAGRLLVFTGPCPLSSQRFLKTSHSLQSINFRTTLDSKGEKALLKISKQVLTLDKERSSLPLEPSSPSICHRLNK